MKEYFEPTLYAFMFKDVPDMNPGKAIAQAMHLSSVFEHDVLDEEYVNWSDSNTSEVIEKWRQSGEYCGRTIVLYGWSKDFYELQKEHNRFLTGLWTDPTYPIRNWHGEVYTNKVATCGYIFQTAPSIAFDEDRKEMFDMYP